MADRYNYTDENSVKWSFAPRDKEAGFVARVITPNAPYPITELVSVGEFDLYRKVQKYAAEHKVSGDRPWAKEKPARSGGGVLLLLAALAFAGKKGKRRGRRR